MLAFTVISHCKYLCTSPRRIRPGRGQTANQHTSGAGECQKRAGRAYGSRVDDDALAVVEDDFVAAEDAHANDESSPRNITSAGVYSRSANCIYPDTTGASVGEPSARTKSWVRPVNPADKSAGMMTSPSKPVSKSAMPSCVSPSHAPRLAAMETEG